MCVCVCVFGGGRGVGTGLNILAAGASSYLSLRGGQRVKRETELSLVSLNEVLKPCVSVCVCVCVCVYMCVCVCV